MKVMVMVKATASSEAGEMPSERLLTEMGNYNQQLVDAGIMLAGEGLHPSSKGKRVLFSGQNRTVTDGPFAETKELIAGFWMWQVKSMEEAIEWVRRCPNPMAEESEIEIRPVFSAEDFGAEFTPELREQEASIRAQALGLGALRFEDSPELSIVGLNESYTLETRGGIADQWHKFAPHIGRVPGQVGDSAYGVCWNTQADCAFDYLVGVWVGNGQAPPDGFQQVTIPAGRYAVYTHTEHVSKLPEALDKIWNKWAPECGLKIADTPCFERYTKDFNPETGLGGTEVWIPVSA